MKLFSRILPLALLVGLLSACASKPFQRTQYITLEATGYCKCGDCCGWHRNLLMQPVYSYGPQKGQRKKVGVTASGTKAQPGTIAADTDVFPFGTMMKIPGYGWGTVEDRGGAIKGERIDLFFKSHKEALEWGR
ncbi:MAG: 3D domain-containing protein, partial [Verrucomicrobiota bacterium]